LGLREKGGNRQHDLNFRGAWSLPGFRFSFLAIEIGMLRSVLFFLAILCVVHAGHSADWPQFRGPNRDAVSAERGWLAHWPESGAKVAWRAQVGKGHSAISVSGGLAYTMGWDGKEESVVCLDAATGKERWRKRYPSDTIVQWPGPRATPTVKDGVVYTLGQHGPFCAWDAASGAAIWRVDLPKSYETDVDYGFAWSPLVEGELVILGTGRAGLAVRKKDGSFAWGNDGRPGASISAVPFTHDGKRGVAVVAMDDARNHMSVVGLDPATGKEWWRFGPWPEKWGAGGTDVIIRDGLGFLSTGEQNKMCVQFRITPPTAEVVWTNRKLSTYTSNVVLLGDYLYGVDKMGFLKCLEWKTGAEKWGQRGFDEYGTLITADGKLIVQSGRSGFLAVVEAVPDGYKEIRRMKIFEEDRATFTAPTLANGYLYGRSYAGEVVCLRVKGD
jgi:outer membrane protein assembly factor BamB